ncbi:MAG: HAD-IIA family hydrolase [Pseudomonadota bacterium]
MSVPTIDVETAFARYEAVRARLPQATFASGSRHAGSLADLAEAFDVFVLDAFGVLNVGERAIPGAVARMAALRAAGKRLIVLTNSATYSRTAALAKYRALGFDFSAEEVVSSRDVAAAALAGRDGLWAAASGPGADFSDLTLPLADLEADPSLFERADGFVLLSSAGWDSARQARLIAALQERPRPLVVANPDLVAPRESGLTLEPGWWAHAAAEAAGIAPEFCGKPFANAYDAVLARLTQADPARIAMVGDTLHTDILGGRAAGLATVLVTEHGLFAGRSTAPYIARSGIVPDYIVPTT